MPFESEAHLEACLADKAAFPRHLETVSADAPELFPARIDEGFVFCGSYGSRIALETSHPSDP